jgi:hypothetical protein
MDASTAWYLVVGLVGVLTGLFAGLAIGMYMASSLVRGSFAHIFTPSQQAHQQAPQSTINGVYRRPTPVHQRGYSDADYARHEEFLRRGSDENPYDLDEFIGSN